MIPGDLSSNFRLSCQIAGDGMALFNSSCSNSAKTRICIATSSIVWQPQISGIALIDTSDHVQTGKIDNTDDLRSAWNSEPLRSGIRACVKQKEPNQKTNES
jgi:hypothetical protein